MKNAVLVEAYVIAVAVVMQTITKFAKPDDTIMAPIFALSMLTLSASVMGYLFLYQPGMLYFEGKKKEGVKLFLHTVGVFAVITFTAMLLMLVWR